MPFSLPAVASGNLFINSPIIKPIGFSGFNVSMFSVSLRAERSEEGGGKGRRTQVQNTLSVFVTSCNACVGGVERHGAS